MKKSKYPRLNNHFFQSPKLEYKPQLLSGRGAVSRMKSGRNIRSFRTQDIILRFHGLALNHDEKTYPLNSSETCALVYIKLKPLSKNSV